MKIRSFVTDLTAALLLFVSSTDMCAQETRRWTLEECITYALENNIDIKRHEITADMKGIASESAKWAYAPDVSASSSYSLSTGRVLDETTYNFVENQSVQGTSTSVGASIVLFNGMRNLHNLKRSQLDLQAALLNVQKARNDIRLNVTACFLEVLCAEENINNALQIVEAFKIQEEKTAKLVKAGKVTSADLLQIRSQLASAHNDLLSARNSYDIARLDICQLLELQDYTTFEAEPPTGEMTQTGISVSQDILLNAAHNLPEVKSARINIDIADRDLQIARSAYYPSLSLSVGYGTSYSDARQKVFQNPDGTYRYEIYPFVEQYRDNASAYLSVGLSIPIFNRLTVRHNVRQQRLAVRDAEYALRAIEKQVDKEATQALIDARTAWQKYLSAQEYVASAEEAVRQIEYKYNLGAATVVEYNTAMNSLVQARTQYLQAKYEYIFKTEIIEFYRRQ